MEEEEFEEYLKERYKHQVQWYDNTSTQNKRYYHWLQWTVIIISASVPALVASIPTWKWITVTLSIILAIATAALKTFKFQENWVNYRTIAETLKKEKHYYDVEAGEYAAVEDKEQLFVERVEALISRENTLWMTIHRRRGNNGETQIRANEVLYLTVILPPHRETIHRNARTPCQDSQNRNNKKSSAFLRQTNRCLRNTAFCCLKTNAR